MPNGGLRAMLLADDVEWLHVYYVNGTSPRGARVPSAIKDPPTNGWALAVIMRGEKRSTIFDPYNLEASQVPNACGELAGAREPRDPMTPGRLSGLIQRKWREWQSLGIQRDYDTAALVLRRLGAEVPLDVLKGGDEDTRRKGGKETGSKLLKPVKRTGKRGKFLEWFLGREGSGSVREVMAEFGMTRSNALSYLYMLQKDHGIGYELIGDVATVTLPDGCENPFDDAGLSVTPPTPTAKPEGDGEDDSWLD